MFVEDKCYASVLEVNDQQDGSPTIVFGNYEQRNSVTPSIKLLKEVVSYYENQQKKKKKIENRKRSHTSEEEEEDEVFSPKRVKRNIENKMSEVKKSDGPKKFMSRKPEGLKLKIPPRLLTVKGILVDEVEMTERQRRIKEKLWLIYAEKVQAEISRLMKEVLWLYS